MMAEKSSPGILIDAVALIDYADSEPALLQLLSLHLGQVHVLTPVLAEVNQFDKAACNNFGVIIVEPEFVQTLEAAQKRGSLSFPDHLCLVVAREKGWTCLTNDLRLRRECASEGVGVLWGLEAIARLVECGALAVEQGKSIATRIHELNPRFITDKVLKEFCVRIGAC